MILYKYYDPVGAVKTLHTLRWKISYASEVNDPFEFCPALENSDFDHQEISNKLIAVKNNQIGKQYAFYSLSAVHPIKNINSLLMWSHYGRSHQGFVFEFDFNNTFVEELEISPRQHTIVNKHNILLPRVGIPMQVEYSNKRSILDNSENAFEELFLRKAPCWQYELEYRILYNINKDLHLEYGEMMTHSVFANFKKNLEVLSPTKYSPQDQFSTVGFPLSSLKKIYCGTNCLPEHVQDIRDMLAKHKLDNVSVTTLRIHTNKFEVVEEDTLV